MSSWFSWVIFRFCIYTAHSNAASTWYNVVTSASKYWNHDSRSVFFFFLILRNAQGLVAPWFKDWWLMSLLLYPLQSIPGPFICDRAQAHDMGLTHTSRAVLLLLDQSPGYKISLLYFHFIFSFPFIINIWKLKCNGWNYNNQITSWAHFLLEVQDKSDSNGLEHSLQQYGIL